MAKYPQKLSRKVQIPHIHFASQVTHLEESTKTNHPLNRTLVIVTRILHGGIQTGFSKRVLLAFGLAVADLTASRLCCESSTQHGIPGGRRF
jgi:predicted oxidoreductase